MATSQRGTEDPTSPHGRPPGRSLHLGRGHTAGLHRHPCLHTSSRVAPHPQHRQGPLDWAPSVLLVVPLRWGLAEAHGPQEVGLGPWVGVAGTAPRAHPATEGGQTGHSGSQSGATGGHSGQRTAGPTMGREAQTATHSTSSPLPVPWPGPPRPDLPSQATSAAKPSRCHTGAW